MNPRRRPSRGSLLLLLALVVSAATGGLPGSAGAAAAARISAACPNVPVYPWQGDFVERPMRVRNESDGRMLNATLFRPADRRRFPGRRAAIVLMRGAGGNQCGQFWSARALAGDGYITLSISAASGLEPKVDAIRSGITFLRSRANPWRRFTHPTRIGAAGHSQGANAVANAQAVDGRIRAIVAFDNLRRYSKGDPGVFLGCRGLPRGEIAPRVPAMGQASDVPCLNRPGYGPPELKKPGFEHWRAAGIPTMELVIRHAIHSDWGGRDNGGADESRKRRIFSYYTRAWFDRWLLQRRAATAALLAPRIFRRSTGDRLSSRFLSGAAFPGAGGCAVDLRSCLH